MHSAWLKITTQAGLNNVQYIKQSSQPVWALLNWTSSSAGRVYQKMHVAEKDTVLSLPVLATFQWLLQTKV